MTRLHRASTVTLSRKRFLLGLAGLSSIAAQAQATSGQTRVLLVVAHPDDEYAFAATTYRLTKELGAVVDQVVITNGEAGFRYSQLAEIYYGVALTREETGRSSLPAIRKNETLAAGRILGIRKHCFLDQKDARFTLDAAEASRIWDTNAVSHFLTELMSREQYEFVFVLLPTDSTHGHHREAAILALEAATRLSAHQRPAILGAEPARAGEPPPSFAGRGLTTVDAGSPVFSFDRRTPLAGNTALSYRIVVNWMIAEHKSQGLFQTEQHDEERYWLFAAGGDHSLEHAQSLFARLRAV